MTWYASGGAIARCGPFSTQQEAWQAMRLTRHAREAQRAEHGEEAA